jgi:hypothetical protein
MVVATPDRLERSRLSDFRWRGGGQRRAAGRPWRVAGPWPGLAMAYLLLAFGIPMPGSILWGPAAEGLTSKSKMAVGM